jgi:hypothetical protein
MAKKDVSEVAAANTTASARRQYGKADAANRALKASVNRGAKVRTGRGKAVPAAVPVAGVRGAVPVTTGPSEAELEAGGYERPQGIDHSYGALDTSPPISEDQRRAAAKGGEKKGAARKGGKAKKARRK